MNAMKVEDSTLAVARALERMGVRHYVTGSLASALHGDPRATNDADLVAELLPMHFERLQRELGGRFYLDEEDFLAATTNQRSFNLVDEVELAKVDVFCVSAEGHAGAALERSVRLPLQRDDPFSEVNVSSPEDSVISKLRWYRQGNEVSDRQWSDVLNVLSVKRATLDLEYLRRWCGELGLADLLERALRQSN